MYHNNNIFFTLLIPFSTMAQSIKPALDSTPYSNAVMQNEFFLSSTQIGMYPFYGNYVSKAFHARVYLTVSELPSGAQVEVSATAALNSAPKQVVEGFLKDVRSGLFPDKAAEYMADTVLAHQITSENPQTVRRTPANYASHVKEFLTLFGRFELKIVELLADGDKVFVRWEQRGIHKSAIDGYKATGLPLIEFTSVVYRVDKGKIVEYWLQNDRAGLDEQLKKNAKRALKD